MYFLIFSLFLTLYGGLNFYIGLRGWQLFVQRISFLDIKIFWAVFAVIALSSIVGIPARKILPGFLRSGLHLVGSYWLAAMTYFLIFIVLIDFMLLLDRWTGVLPEAAKGNPAFSFALGLCALLAVASLLVYGTQNGKILKVTSYEINIPKEAGSLSRLRIALVSDLHLGPINDHRQQKIIDSINGLNPDIVLVPGDIIDDIVLFDKTGILGDLTKIKSTYGVYASLGNHDYLGEDPALNLDRLSKAGIGVLRDSSVKIADSFYLIGREDKYARIRGGKKRAPLTELMHGMNLELPVILLDHQPVDLQEAENAGVDLQLSGHTHKGQFFPINLITRRIFPVDYGYLAMEGLQVIVTSGAGTWGPPIRIGSSCEIVDIRVSFQRLH